ncbi:MAG: site-specific DNA-methyltransferase [Lachnospiraceae bacterium]|nr:site-specific DNA-methyltransferase [Lachnospiraceae bacterium]MDY4165087.1 site-specific DNA-methyltransferase [Lachnospiraceae bacterium]
MEKLKMHTPDLAEENYKKLAALFPDAVTETITGYDEKGRAIVERAIDKDVLMQEINAQVVDDGQERYQFTWPDKRKSVVLANAPIAKTLRFEQKKSVGRDGTPGGIDSENIYIEGDNLDALKLLQETYLGKVDVIYIDPPYNTGNDFIYEDDFSQSSTDYIDNSGQTDEEGNRLVQNNETNGRFHTDWLNMLYPRLRLAKDLLSKDNGVLAISIGFHEMCNLVKLCQDIFGGYQIFPVTVKTSGGKPNGAINISTEYVVIVAPANFIPTPAEEDMKDYASPYHGMNLATFNQVERPNQAYPVFVNKEHGNIVGVGKSLQQRIDDGELTGFVGDFVYDYDEAPSGTVAVWPVSNKGEQCVWRLIPERLLNDWKKGYIKVLPNKGSSTKNEFTIQYLSGGIISKINSGEIEPFRISDNPLIPTLEIKNYKTAGSGIASIWDDKNFYTTKGSNEIKEIFDGKFFSYPKPVELISYILKRTTDENSVVVDFFSGSATTADALMRLNSKDAGHRTYILIQLPEETEKNSDANKAGYETICDIGEERIRRAGKKIKEETGADIDYGFRCFKVDSSNMKDVYYRPADIGQMNLDQFTDNIKEDRTPEDLLIQVMLDLGVLLSSKVEQTEIAGKKVFSVDDGYLIACFDKDVTEDVVTEIAKKHPFYAVFRDSSMANDSVAANFEQIFDTYSPQTVRKVL